MDNNHKEWRQGQFIDQRRYDHMSSEWKQQCRMQEALLVRPSPLGNSICKAQSPDEAIWIAQRLNLAATPVDLTNDEIINIDDGLGMDSPKRCFGCDDERLIAFARAILKAANEKRGLNDY
jgi:hypothetical protein